MRLILVRHGLTQENLTEVIQGAGQQRLNERGEQQADALARRLSIQHLDSIYSSDLVRARQTANRIASYHRHLVPIFDSRLRERSVGNLAGRPYDDFLTAATEAKKMHHHFRPPAGESLQDVGRRAKDWHEDMQRRHYGQLIVVVTHGHWLQSYLGWLLQGTIDERRKKFKHYNTGMTVLDLHETKPTLLMLNDIAHLG